MATKKVKPTPEKKVEVKQTYTKDVLLKADRWKDRFDLVNALLLDGRVYTIDEVDQMISDYYHKEV